MNSWTNFIVVSRITVEINLVLWLSSKEAVKVKLQGFFGWPLFFW